MRIQIAALLIITAAFSTTPACVRAATPTDDARTLATLTVAGQGSISRPPDVATIALTIVTNDESAARALSENNRRFNALGAKLATAGIEAADIVSTSLTSYFNPRPTTPAADATGQLYGFVVTRNVQVNVKALAATGRVVDAATAAGATQINGVTYGFRDGRSVERAALAAAVSDALVQAQTIAGAAHVQIVRVLRIGEDGAAREPVRPMAMMMAHKSDDSVPTTITPSNVDVSSSIAVTFEIR